MKTYSLNDGNKIPALGLGTWKLADGSECFNAVKWALKTGYRHIDTATVYGNETSVGKAVQESGLERKEVFITTKLWNTDHEQPQQAFEESLKRLKMDYVDLYLIHWPVGERLKTWKALEKIKDSELTKSIGVSNFTIKHLNELIENTGVIPAVNQVEFSPFLYQKELLDYCRGKRIQLEAYSPLTRGDKLNHPMITKVAEKHGRTNAQVMIRWAIEHEVVVIPKSANKERIKENYGALDFKLDTTDLKQLDSLNENLRKCWDPSEIE